MATHLAVAFHNAGFSIDGIFSRTHESALALATKVESIACRRIEETVQHSQLLIVAVPDQALPGLLDFPVPDDVLIVHTCGTVEMREFSGKAARFGVLYPLQTFSRDVPVELKKVPFCIEASDHDSLEMLRQAASTVSDSVVEIASDKRKILHLAAVFACNFSNTMYAMADDILKTAGLPPELLHPLVIETARKATFGQPWDVQTGPARRHDISTLLTHEALLNEMASYEDIYKLLSHAISKHYRAEEE